jgi:hypothetical protein
MRPTPLALIFPLALAACGSKTGLRDLRFDALVVDDAVVIDPVCRPLRVRTRVGIEAPLRSEVDLATPRTSGFVWSIRQGPARSRAMLRATDTDQASLTPDAAGTYDIVVTTPYVLSSGERLQCGAVVEAEPEDPLCPEYALGEPSVVPLPGSTQQFGFERSWSTPRVNNGGPNGTGAVASDDVAHEVTSLVWEFESTRDLAATAGEVEGRVAGAVGATPVLVGREGDTQDGFRYRRSSFRVGSRPTTAAVLRDRVARDVVGLVPGASREGFSVQSAFVIEVTTVLRPAEGRAVMIFAAAPEAFYDDPRRATATALQDVTNTSGLARAGASLDVVCQRIVATRLVTADFLWLVDTSRSMEDDQERLGNTAQRFFTEMNAAGIDFRVGVVQAGSAASGPDLDDPGFAWISGSDPMGPRRLAWEVTYRPYRNLTEDTFAPYPLEGQEEEPVAAGVVTTLAMERRAPSDPDARRSFRRGAQKVAFFVTDESGENDDGRFFARSPATWGPTGADHVRNAARWYTDRDFLTFGMANIFTRMPCPAVQNFSACVVLGSGGAYIPLDTALDAEVSSALSRIVDATAGAASEFSLTRPPVSSTLRVAVDQVLAPRSRADGFDWDQDARAIVFRGATYRPRRGQAVRAAYFLWGRR